MRATNSSLVGPIFAPKSKPELEEAMNEQKAAWAVDLDRNWTFKNARILPDGERFILNVAGMLVTDFESEEAKQYHSDNFLTEGR